MVLSLLFFSATAILLPSAFSQAQCDLDNIYMLGDIAIPSVVDSEPMYMDDYSKIISPEDQALEIHHRRSRRAAVRDRSRLWPDNTIPYAIDPDFNEYYVRLLKRAMQTWEESTCVRFVPRTIEQDYVQIKQGRRCCSYVGRQKRGGQKMALDPGCMQHGILLHEFGHVIGFWHEQNRPDRDEYIKVISNYHHSVRYNFDKLNESTVHDYGVPYDYDSIMHYGTTFFSIDGRSTTLQPLKEDVEIGQRLRLSERDILQANRLYMCNKTCSYTFNASESPGTFSSMNYPDMYPPKTDCIKLIYAKPGHVIRIVFDNIDIEHHSECKYDYLEVRDGDLPTSPVLGEKFCGFFQQRNFTSSGPALWVKLHTDSSVSRTGFFAHFHAFDEDKSQIQKINPCDLKVCEHSCSVTKSDVAICLCPLGYQLNEDGVTCGDRNECYLNNGGCSHICTNHEGGYTCQCPRGFSLGPNRMTCQDIDECDEGTHRCTQTCVNSPGNYECRCRDGYRLSWDQVTCVDVNECLTRNGGCEHSCINSIGSYRCTCESGYNVDPTDPSSCVDIDECLVNNGDCANNNCYNTPGSWFCGCDPGYEIDETSQSCVDTNECLDDNGGCEHKCVNTAGSYYCRCRHGYRLNGGYSCEDVDECLMMDCGGGVCENRPGTYRCECFQGFHYERGSCKLDRASFGVITDNAVEQGADISAVLPRAQSSECRNVFISEPGPLDSPRYPLNYPPNTTCSWLVQSPSNARIDITFLFFDLEYHDLCRWDSLTIYDGTRENTPQLKKMCGRHEHPVKYSSSGPSMLLTFASDKVLSKRGFHAAIDFVQDDETHCGGQYYTDRHSREIHWKKRGIVNCMWQIEAEADRYILLNFVIFRMSDSRGTEPTTCSLDETLEVYATATSRLLGRFCFNHPPPKLFHAYHSAITIVGRGLLRSSSMDVLILHSSTSQYVRYSVMT